MGGHRIWLSPPDVDGFEAQMAAHLGDGMHAAALASGTAGLAR